MENECILLESQEETYNKGSDTKTTNYATMIGCVVHAKATQIRLRLNGDIQNVKVFIQYDGKEQIVASQDLFAFQK